jgi:hypothetical protein
MGLYLQAVQRQHAEEGLNRAMGGIAAAFAPPGQAGVWMHSMDNMSQDPTGMMGNIMKLQQYQYEQQIRQQDLANMPGYAKQIYGDNPTPEQIATTRMLYNSGQLPQAIEQSQGITGTGPKANMRLAGQAWDRDHPGQPRPAYMTGAPDEYAIQSKDITDAQTAFPTLSTQLDFTHQKVQDVLNNPELKSALGKYLASGVADQNSFWTTLAQGLPSSIGGMTPGEQKALADIGQLRGLQNSQAFTTGQGRRSTQETMAIAKGLGQLQDLKNPNFIPALQQVDQQLSHARANAYGAAGYLDQMPVELESSLNAQYKPGGRLYSGGQLPSSRMPSVSSPDDVAKLPSGTQFIIPSGPHKGEIGTAP